MEGVDQGKTWENLSEGRGVLLSPRLPREMKKINPGQKRKICEKKELLGRGRRAGRKRGGAACTRRGARRVVADSEIRLYGRERGV